MGDRETVGKYKRGIERMAQVDLMYLYRYMYSTHGKFFHVQYSHIYFYTCIQSFRGINAHHNSSCTVLQLFRYEGTHEVRRKRQNYSTSTGIPPRNSWSYSNFLDCIGSAESIPVVLSTLKYFKCLEWLPFLKIVSKIAPSALKTRNERE